MDGSLRGIQAATRRSDLLEAFRDLGVIDFAKSTIIPRREAAQYLVRIGDQAAPWRCLDGKELLPWLLGITEAHAVLSPDHDTTRRMWELLEPFNAGADEAPAEEIAEALAVRAANDRARS